MIKAIVKRCKNFSTRVTSEGGANKGANKNFKEGDKVSVTRSITADDVLEFAKLTKDYNPIHVSSKRNIVHGALLNGFVSGVLGTKLPGAGTIVAEQKFKFPNSCYVGDTVEITVEITSIRKIITCKYSCIANSEKTVMEGEAKIIMSSNFEPKKIVFVK